MWGERERESCLAEASRVWIPSIEAKRRREEEDARANTMSVKSSR